MSTVVSPIPIVEDVVQRLLADEYFSDITVICDRDQHVLASLSKGVGSLTAKGGKAGVCCVVQQPSALDEFPDTRNTPLLTEVSVLVLECVSINTGSAGTCKDAYTVAKRALRALKHYRSEGVADTFGPGTPCIIPADAGLSGHVAYEVRLTTYEHDDDLVKVAPPIINPRTGAAPQTVTISCATSGASIYYTLDGSHPHVGNSAAVLYSDPIAISEGCVLRAGAFKTGCIGSDIPRAEYT